MLGNPQISIPIQVTVADNVDLKIARGTSSNKKASIDEWIFEGEQFTAYIDVYSYSSSSASSKEQLSNLNPSAVTMSSPAFGFGVA